MAAWGLDGDPGAGPVAALDWRWRRDWEAGPDHTQWPAGWALTRPAAAVRDWVLWLGKGGKKQWICDFCKVNSLGFYFLDISVHTF
jgi:hypothetical protein